jgi:hypothetical protein
MFDRRNRPFGQTEHCHENRFCKDCDRVDAADGAPASCVDQQGRYGAAENERDDDGPLEGADPPLSERGVIRE